MWIHFEGDQNCQKLTLTNNELNLVADMDDFRKLLCERFTELRNVEFKGNIEFHVQDDNEDLPFQPLNLKTKLSSLDLGDESTIYVRYPLSNRTIDVNFKYSCQQGNCKIPHHSGSFSLLQEKIMEKFVELQEQEIYFFHEDTKTEIHDELEFKVLISRTRPVNDVYILNRLKVMIEGRKPYSEWSLDEVLREILGNKYSSIIDMPVLQFEQLPQLRQPISKNLLKNFFQELRTAYQNEINTNEQTSCQFIAPFMKHAVHYAQLYINKNVYLANEWELKGTRGDGPIDFVVFVNGIVLLVCEAKLANMNQGIAQVLVQLYSAIEVIMGKYNRPPTAMYGVATTGIMWRFVRWSQSLEDPIIHLSKQYICSLNSDGMKEETKVITYIAQILEIQEGFAME